MFRFLGPEKRLDNDMYKKVIDNSVYNIIIKLPKYCSYKCFFKAMLLFLFKKPLIFTSAGLATRDARFGFG